MIKANEGNEEARTQKREKATNHGSLTVLNEGAKGAILLLNCGLTCFLARRGEYFFALCAACLSLAAASIERLKTLRIGLQGLRCEWRGRGQKNRRRTGSP